ncbi:hypothetical protein OZ410_12650 [Robiginitalea sp. M366]|uniref:hypothetical protein n=1 Tax=Robiginitalea aestuariiviva TaxID=3036903 RepID=UPI00240D6097|nr:hypothetical protein [Robiginitalea aestuariiviva]MDG1573172.1 hypothetical protein [Robiginitalea aestuariiviva]
MSNNPQDAKFKKWLDVLQQESWQLELIISGFAIYGLFAIIGPIELAGMEADNDNNLYRKLLFQGLEVSWYIITINLIAHVILRGLWIGAIGLRYVSGEIDYDKLRYSPKFTRHLQRRVGSFDNYVATLEKYCSVIFAVTFLLVFYLLGLLILVCCFTLLGLWLDQDDLSNALRSWVIIPMIIFLALGMILTFIDFATQGWLKRITWIARIYYPFYWVFKYLTLSFLYRPMVYNFLDTRFGKRLNWLVVPLYLGIVILAGTGFSTSNYLDRKLNATDYSASKANYLDTLDDETAFVDRASIPSKVISDPYLNVFIVYGSSVEDDVFYFQKDLKPEEDLRGLYSIFSEGTVNGRSNKLRTYLETLEDMYTLSVDSTDYKPELVFAVNARKQMGYETYLDLAGVPRGKHLLRVQRKDHDGDSIYLRTIIRIPFWYYPNPVPIQHITP